EEQYLSNHFFNPLDEPKTMGVDLLGNSLIEGDEVYKAEKGLLLVSALTKGQKEMAKALELRKVAL
ncbi:hypothetical protein, partial [Periweissella ghanensis]